MREPRGCGRGSELTQEATPVAIVILRNSGTDHPREAIGPLGSNCFSWEVLTTLCEVR